LYDEYQYPPGVRPSLIFQVKRFGGGPMVRVGAERISQVDELLFVHRVNEIAHNISENDKVMSVLMIQPPA
jgi:hypothetical protein